MLSNRNVLGLSLGHAAMLFNLYFLISWLPTYLIQQHHLTALNTGLYGSIPWLFGLLGVIVGGRGSDILIKRGWPIVRARKVFLVLGMALAMVCLLTAYVELAVGGDRMPLGGGVRHLSHQQRRVGGERGSVPAAP